MKRNIIVSGSLAYDRIMDFPGYFHEHILPDNIHGLNVCIPSERGAEKDLAERQETSLTLSP